jgi:hypothetical protein
MISKKHEDLPTIKLQMGYYGDRDCDCKEHKLIEILIKVKEMGLKLEGFCLPKGDYLRPESESVSYYYAFKIVQILMMYVRRVSIFSSDINLDKWNNEKIQECKKPFED